MSVKRVRLLIAGIFYSTLCGQDIRTVVTEYTARGKAYTITYPFPKNEGLVRIITASTWKADLAKTHTTFLTIRRTAENKAVITADISQGIISMYDADDPHFIGHTGHCMTKLPWHPWHDDTCNGVRGGNRLKLYLEYPGRYTVTVPGDADIEAELGYGLIRYVIYKARSGREHRAFDSWSDEGIPRTKLSTPNRRIEIMDTIQDL